MHASILIGKEVHSFYTFMVPVRRGRMMQLFRIYCLLQLAAAIADALVVGSTFLHPNKKSDQQTSLLLGQSYASKAGKVSARPKSHWMLSSSAVSSSTSTDDAVEEDVNEILDRALNGDSQSASKLLDTIRSLRENESLEQTALDDFLGKILDRVDQSRKPLWTKIRYTSKLSRRSRLAALHRLLNISTPQAAAEDNDTLEAKKSRRRRALVVALRSLVQEEQGENEEKQKYTTIYDIEKAARKDLKEQSSAKDMESRLPSGLETPKYSVVSKYPKYEIRKYDSFSVCSVPMSKPRPDAKATDEKVSQPQLMGASSFGALAGYLFGKNEEQTAMKMTTPVLTVGEGEEREMSFVLPSNYWSEESLSKAPTPLRNSLVQLKRDEGGTRAVVMFGGFASSKEVESKKEELLNNLKSNKEWCVVPGSPLTLAQYNDPFTPPWKRRNEVSVLVQPLT